jgi:hypothetical protein
MLTQGLFAVTFVWTTWLALGVGLAVTGLVFLTLARFRPRRGGLAAASAEEDLPWEDLLELMRRRQRERLASGAPPDDDDLSPEELLKQLLPHLPTPSARRPPEIPPEELQFLKSGGADLRASRRRWGNPTDVYLTLPLRLERLHGLVINRSTGGLAIFVDEEIPAGTVVHVRSGEAPNYVPAVEVEVKHCRQGGKNFVIGCQFRGEIPWNARVWFG